MWQIDLARTGRGVGRAVAVVGRGNLYRPGRGVCPRSRVSQDGDGRRWSSSNCGGRHAALTDNPKTGRVTR
jgi:hypothetical protein